MSSVLDANLSVEILSDTETPESDIVIDILSNQRPSQIDCMSGIFDILISEENEGSS